ncbi:hypothetical protein X750_16835 [Mesorhizobium sp. LNJC394B00]|nr:hypothetical protein X750_16835 [Mesorhizobium sp. LNJC394B00]
MLKRGNNGRGITVPHRMKTSILAAILIVASGLSAAAAQTDTSICEALAGPSDEAAGGSRKFVQALESVDYPSARPQLHGTELEAFDAMVAAKDQALGPLKEFTERFEDFAYLMRRCAR